MRSDSDVGWRNDTELTTKKPVLAVIYIRTLAGSGGARLLAKQARTKEVRRSAQGDDAIAGDGLAVTAGGINVQRSMARVNPSTIARGISFSKLEMGMRLSGRYSMIAWMVAYNAGTVPDTMNDGGSPRNGPIACGQS